MHVIFMLPSIIVTLSVDVNIIWPYSHFLSKVNYLILQIYRGHRGQKIIAEGIII
jgi:hypothetical protein